MDKHAPEDEPRTAPFAVDPKPRFRWADRNTPDTVAWERLRITRFVTLTIAPLVLLAYAVSEALRPTVGRETSKASTTYIDAFGEHVPGHPGHTVGIVTRLDDPSFLDTFAVFYPAALLALMFGYVGYALYRIEVNFREHDRPYTEKDEKTLGRALRFFVSSTLFLILADLVLFPLVFDWHSGTLDGGLSGTLSITLLAALIGIEMLLFTAQAVYRRGRESYLALEEAKRKLEDIA